MSKRKQTNREKTENHVDSTFIGAWVPHGLAAALDRAVVEKDSDRSKLVREALREKLQSLQQAA